MSITGSFPDEHEFYAPKEYGFFSGIVKQRDDPERRGRVKINIPGLFELSTWAFPVGMPGAGGSPGGGFCVPELDAQVIVGFLQGDIDYPFYFAGPHALTETPQAIQDAASAAEAADTRSFETSTFEITIKDNDTEKKIKIGTKATVGDTYIEIDANDKSILLKSDTFIIMDAPMITMENAGKIQLHGRVVLPLGNPI